MKLQVRSFRLEAGRPIAFLNDKDAKKLFLHSGDRIRIHYHNRDAIAILDIASTIIGEGQIVLSKEAIKSLSVNPGDKVEISLLSESKGASIINGRLKCAPYTKEQLFSIMRDIVNNAMSEAEVAYFVSGVYHCGLSLEETIHLTQAIVGTGKQLKWHTKKIADKHSIGGIPGNRTTPIVVSICAAAGVVMPKTSSRAITSPAGTADVVESIAKVDFPAEELQKIVKKTGACLAWGGSLGLAPADDKLIQVEKMLKLDPEPQLLASIMAKKLAVGSKYVLIDIPAGEGAKIPFPKARHLKKKFEQIGKKFGMKMRVVITDGCQPIGNGIGPILEIKDIIRVLKRDNSPKDLEKKSLYLSGQLLELVGKAKKGSGEKLAKQILESGKAFNKFQEIIEAQHGTINHLKDAKFSFKVHSTYSGKIQRVDNKIIANTARITGCPLDKSAGLYIHKHKNDRVKEGETVLTLYSESKDKLKQAMHYLNEKNPFYIK